jgi:D-arabinose 1-dehydrogenase-like Zn-dependent alcohol dehydrogenase
MKAAIVHDFTAPLAIKELPVPQAGSGEVVVRIETSGLCHTDIHAAHGDWPVKPNPPFIPGHEGVGIVASLGEGVTEVAVGDRVALPWLGYACGAASTAPPVGKRCASSSATPAIPSTAVMPSTPWPRPSTSPGFPTPWTRSTPHR